ncbi:unnamed protein product, partial [Brachionus calyciflorus]
MFFKKDQIILKETPFVIAIDLIQNKNYCGFCFQNKKLFECPSCQHFFYCSRECERKDVIHKKECTAFKNYSECGSCDLLEIDLQRLFLRILVRTKMDINPIELASFNSLTDEYDNIVKDKERINQFKYLKNGIRQIMGNEFLSEFSEKDLISYFGRMLIHKTNVKSGNNLIGMALYLEASRYKHSCEPNTTISFSDSKLILKANRLITQDESPTISLCETNLSDSERKTYLKKFFYFDCHCLKCTGTQPIKVIFAEFEINCNSSLENIGKTKIVFETRPANDKKHILSWTYRESNPNTIYINKIFQERLEILKSNRKENIEEIETITFLMCVLILHELAHLLFRWKGVKVTPDKIKEAGIKLEDWLFGGKVMILTKPRSNWSSCSKHYGIRIRKIVTDIKYSRLSYPEYISKVCHFKPEEDFELYTTLVCDEIKNEPDTLALKSCDQLPETSC